MNPQSDRAREHFPSVLLGVLGIIQALALELLWERGVEGIGRWQAIDAEASGWLQAASVFLGIVVVWVMFASLVLRFSWVPRFFDLGFPFVLGALEFLLVASCGPESIARFFAVLAVVFVVAAAGNNSVYQTLFATGDAPAPPRREQLASYAPPAVMATILLGSAALVARAGPASAATLACLLVANAGLVVQLVAFRHYWVTQMREIEGSA